MAFNRTNSIFGQVLKETRSTAGIKRADFAAKIGITANHVSVLEQGHKSATFELVTRMVKVLNIPLTTFVAEIERRLTKGPDQTGHTGQAGVLDGTDASN